MLNNAIDHSGGSFVDVSILAPQGGVAFEVRDDGIGALRRARETFGLENDVDAVAEFSKGKRTTMPERHSGEGIFFTSKAMDRFVLSANGVRWIVDNIADDQALGDAPGEAGTRVRCEISRSSSRTLRSVFDRYSLAPEEMPAFDRTTTRRNSFAWGGRSCRDPRRSALPWVWTPSGKPRSTSGASPTWDRVSSTSCSASGRRDTRRRDSCRSTWARPSA